MGCEFGQWKEWDFETPLDWALLEFPLHEGVRRLVADLNNLYLKHPTWAKADHDSDKFQWVDCNDSEGQTLSFLKFGEHPSDTLLVACNFSDQLRHRDWGCPHQGHWRVLLDTDSQDYAGGELQVLRILNPFPIQEITSHRASLLRLPVGASVFFPWQVKELFR